MLLYILCVLKGKAKADRGNLRPTAKVKTRVPWIPPGKASIQDPSYKWEVTQLKEKLHLISTFIFKRLFLLQHCYIFICAEMSVTESLICTKGPTHRLEIIPPLPEPEPEHSQSALLLADLTSEEEEGLHGRISQYERKIDSLMTEVSSLKNEVSFSSVSALIWSSLGNKSLIYQIPIRLKSIIRLDIMFASFLYFYLRTYWCFIVCM